MCSSKSMSSKRDLLIIQGFSCLSKSGSRGRLIWENSLLIFKIGKNGLGKPYSLFDIKIIQKHAKLHLITSKNILKFVFRDTLYLSKPTTNLNVISCNFVIFGVIFMKFSSKCNTKSDIGKFILKFGNFCLYLGKTGAD